MNRYGVSIRHVRSSINPLNGLKRSSALTCLITGVALLAPALACAADSSETVASLEAENARLRAQLQRAEQVQTQLAKACADEAVPRPQQISAAAALGVATASDEDKSGSSSSSELCTVVVQSDREKQVVERADKLNEVKDIPVSISVVSGEDLVKEDAFDIGSITKRATGVTWNQGNQRTSSISIRGIGQVGQNEAQLPSVGVQVDGVPYAFNPLTSSYNFIDLADVEITHGPQGTTGGLNNSLGTIAINTKAPTFTPDSNYLLTYGERNTLIAQFAQGGPIIDGLLAYRATAGVQKGKGDIANGYITDKSYQNTDRTTGRLQFLLTPTQNFSALLSVNLTPYAGELTNNRTFFTPTPGTYDDGKPNTALTNDQRLARNWFTQDPNFVYTRDYYNGGSNNSTVYIDGDQQVVTGSYGGTLNLDWKVGGLDVKSITAWETYHFNARNDEGTQFAISTTGGVYDNNYTQLSQEFKATGSIGELLDYTGGLFAMRTRTNYQSYSNWLQDAGAWYASNAQYATLAVDGNGRYLLENSLTATWKDTYQDIRNRTAALYGNVVWHATNSLNLTAGARGTYDDRQNGGSTLLSDWGNGSALNPVSVNGVNLGGFGVGAASTNYALTSPNSAIPVAQTLNGATYAAGTITQLQLANLVAAQYFGSGQTWASLTNAQKAQVSAAQALRKTQIGTLWNYVPAQTYNRITPTIFLSPSYKINDRETVYANYQHGEKAGVSQLINGLSGTTLPERTDAYELGSKSMLLDGALILNFDVFWMDIHNYQQSIQVYDAYTTALNNDGSTYYTAATGSAGWVQSRGAEFDLSYEGIRNLTIRLNGIWVDSYYKEFAAGAKPNELSDLSNPYIDYSGKVLPGSAKFQGVLGAEYRLPVFGDKVFHIGFDTTYRSANNLDNTLSRYSWVPGGTITDAQVGIGQAGDKFDLSFVVKNLTNNNIDVAKTWNSYSPAFRQWYGVQATGKL